MLDAGRLASALAIEAAFLSKRTRGEIAATIAALAEAFQSGSIAG